MSEKQDTRPDRKVLGYLTAKLYAAADREGLDRELVEKTVEYLNCANATFHAYLDSMIHNTIYTAKNFALQAKLEEELKTKLSGYIGTTTVTEDTIRLFKREALQLLVKWLPSDPIPDISVHQDPNDPTRLIVRLSAHGGARVHDSHAGDGSTPGPAAGT